MRVNQRWMGKKTVSCENIDRVYFAYRKIYTACGKIDLPWRRESILNAKKQFDVGCGKMKIGGEHFNLSH